MGIFKYVHYIYLVLAVLFIVEGISKITSDEGTPWAQFALAAAAIFMFFFRKKFSGKMEDRYKK